MQVKLEVLEGLNRKLTIEIPKEEITKSLDKKIKGVQKTAKIDGFRKGKVPVSIIRSKYEVSMLQDVLSKSMQDSYDKAIRDEKIAPAGHPKITPMKGVDGKENFVYEAVFEVIPEFEVKGLDSLAIKKPIAKVEDADINNMIDTLKKQAITFEESNNIAKEEDKVTVDFVGKIDSEVFEGGSANDAQFVIGAKQMLEEFEKPVIGKKEGETVNATVNFPDDYHGKDVAGKTAVFEITIKKVESPILPEVNEDFIKRFGIVDGKEETFKKAINDNMTRELDASIRKNINSQVMQHLIDSNKVVIPESMVDQEKDRMVKETGLEKQTNDPERIKEARESMFDQPARRRVLLGLIMGKLFETMDIKPDSNLVEEKIKNLSMTYEKPEEVIEYYKSNPKAMEQIYAQSMEDQLINALLEKATITEENKTFDDLMNNKAE